MITSRLRYIIATLFQLKETVVTLETSPDNVQNWDSLQHLNLIIALEQEFGISIAPDEGTELLSVGIIELFLKEKGIIVDGEENHK